MYFGAFDSYANVTIMQTTTLSAPYTFFREENDLKTDIVMTIRKGCATSDPSLTPC